MHNNSIEGRKRFPVRSSAFTLIELMVSLAMMLVLILGISRVFQMTSNAIGAGNALNTATQKVRGATAVINQDFTYASATPQPFMFIECEQNTCFMDQADLQTDPYYIASGAWRDDTSALQVTDSTGAMSKLSRANYGNRSSRCDAIGMFALGKFTSQCGLEPGNSPLVSPVNSREAFVWYGHLFIADNTGTYPPTNRQCPGNGLDQNNSNPASTNPNNFFARDWTLGRVVTLLASPIPNDPAVSPAAPCGAYMQYVAPGVGSFAGSPLNYTATAPDGLINWQARYDLAQGTIAKLKQDVSAATSFTANTVVNQFGASLHMGGAYGPGRYMSQNFVAKPITAKGMSLRSNVFLRNCSRFIVEFAGDFVKQNPDGTLINTTGNPSSGWEGQDGQIDFFIDPSSGAKKIRWYGLPRDLNGDGVVIGQTAVACPHVYPTTGIFDPNQLVDVVPLRDVLQTGLATISNASFEATFPYSAPPVSTDYGAVYDSVAPPGLPKFAKYFCGWKSGQTMPSLVRFLVTLEDPNSRTNGQTFECVMSLK